MLFALLGGQVDGAASHYQPPVPRGQSEAHGEGQKQQEQGSRSRVPSQTPHLSYPQMLTKSQPQSAPSQDTPLHTPEQSQMVIPSEQQDQSMAPLSISQNPAQMDGNRGNSGPEMFATASSLSLSNTQSNRPQSSSGGAWMMPVMDSNCGPIVLPLAPPVPTSTPFDGFVSLPGTFWGHGGLGGGGGGGGVGGGGDGGVGMTNDLGMMGMSLPEELCSAPLAASAPPAGTAPERGAADEGGMMTIMNNPPELWEKLQAFYEPSAPVFWEGNV
ncbi:hypothetical protein C367_06461, partial [Cryptococcus neoformans Ze90-1]